MPEYRATRFVNTREADTCRFTAGNDEAAREMLLAGNHPDWSGDADLVDCDFPDEVFALDRRCSGGSYESVEEEILSTPSLPYGGAARDFVLLVASLGEKGAYDGAVETLDRLITSARTLCGREPVTAITPGKVELG
jgi:hypothetical protein